MPAQLLQQPRHQHELEPQPQAQHPPPPLPPHHPHAAPKKVAAALEKEDLEEVVDVGVEDKGMGMKQGQGLSPEEPEELHRAGARAPKALLFVGGTTGSMIEGGGKSEGAGGQGGGVA